MCTVSSTIHLPVLRFSEPQNKIKGLFFGIYKKNNNLRIRTHEYITKFREHKAISYFIFDFVKTKRLFLHG